MMTLVMNVLTNIHLSIVRIVGERLLIRVDLMNAEQMFKELGYECRYFKQYIYYTKVVSTMTIEFNLKKKDYHCVCGMAFKNPNKEEKKAIQKQMEELGWI
nr:MAG TPA: hypothetical protein [Caudoviricetes sp.]